LWGSDGIQYCRRGENEELDPQNVQLRVKHGGGSIIVWGCITLHGVRRLVRVQRKMKAEQYCQILTEGLIGTLQDYNITADSIWFLANNINVLPWPSNSPDMNIIEHVWHELEKQYNHHDHHACNTNELFVILEEDGID
jgi:hypothetical protein